MTDILGVIARTWWIAALRGVAAILFGVCALLWPALTVAVLITLFGAFALVDGAMAVVIGIWARWWSVAMFGLLGLMIGAFALVWPSVTAVALLFIVAFWLIARGVFEIGGAAVLRSEIANEWLLILSGLLSIAVGVVLMAYAAPGILAVVWLIAIEALLVGLLFIVLAFRLRGLRYGVLRGA
ncbi:MAG TPA: DUF308 domain-containing protein [Vicinamibacterales bacterium]|nr:DUF308 domain-containing protein [Vicinamibacterales bacterium]